MLSISMAACAKDPEPAAVTVTGTVHPAPATALAPTTTAPSWRSQVLAEHEVNPAYRQGLATDPGTQGWVLSTNNGLWRTDGMFQGHSAPSDKADLIIPAQLAQQGYNHVGDIDITGDVLWAPIEKDDKDSGQQVIARFDAATFRFIDSFVVPQHHASFVTVSPDLTVCSTDGFDDDTILRYRFTGSALEPIEPVHMSRKIERIQGGDLAGGALWISTDDERNGLYRVDLDTGVVQSIGSMGYADGEGEGIDAQPSADGSVALAALSIDAKLIPVRVISISATSR